MLMNFQYSLLVSELRDVLPETWELVLSNTIVINNTNKRVCRSQWFRCWRGVGNINFSGLWMTEGILLKTKATLKYNFAKESLQEITSHIWFTQLYSETRSTSTDYKPRNTMNNGTAEESYSEDSMVSLYYAIVF